MHIGFCNEDNCQEEPSGGCEQGIRDQERYQYFIKHRDGWVMEFSRSSSLIADQMVLGMNLMTPASKLKGRRFLKRNEIEMKRCDQHRATKENER